MKGRRVCPGSDGFYAYASLKAGDYFIQDGRWGGITPNGHHCNLTNHKVTEHDDGTITVLPSIIVCGDSTVVLWHGFLEKGIWRSV